jgi:penicillin amidase
MFLDLNLSAAHVERTYASIREELPAALVAMLLPQSNRWDAPLETGEVPGVVIPDSDQVDLRGDQGGDAGVDDTRAGSRPESAGSNNWAVAAALTGHGMALLANDMHLGHALPNIWYRAQLSWPEDTRTRTVVGVSLPGAPALVAGSNGDVAWGFTNSQGDWCDLVKVEIAPGDSTLYRTPSGLKRIQRTLEVIEVAGAAPDTSWVKETIWGPIWTHDGNGHPLALRWTAYDSTAVNLNLVALESAADVDTVVAMASRLGIPEQNLVCADRHGRIAWALAGAIPHRVGFSGRFPVSWADGSCRWDGYCSAKFQPKLVDPPEGRLWTANNRVTAGEDLRLIGDGGYALGARARQIREDLRALDRPVEKDMLAIQLDDRAVFMGEWRGLLLRILERAKPSPNGPRSEFLRIIRDEWSGRAGVESAAYRLVREATEACVDEIYSMLTAPCAKADPDFHAFWLPYRHAVSWELLTRQPRNLLTNEYRDWEELVLSAVDRVITKASADGRDLQEYQWGERNVVDIAHPFCRLHPWLRRWLAVPKRALPGDSWMPRVQHPRRGASERMVVSPGQEERGIFEMPGGESGHPLSPFFTAGTKAWEEGRATPLLPGPAAYELILSPPPPAAGKLAHSR